MIFDSDSKASEMIESGLPLLSSHLILTLFLFKLLIKRFDFILICLDSSLSLTVSFRIEMIMEYFAFCLTCDDLNFL